jgi:hypothetical protein
MHSLVCTAKWPLACCAHSCVACGADSGHTRFQPPTLLPQERCSSAEGKKVEVSRRDLVGVLHQLRLASGEQGYERPHAFLRFRLGRQTLLRVDISAVSRFVASTLPWGLLARSVPMRCASYQRETAYGGRGSSLGFSVTNTRHFACEVRKQGVEVARVRLSMP